MSHQAPPELTVRAIVLAIVLGVILAAANAYLGLFAGMTIASAIPAAVVSMAVLKLMGGGHILENNIVATGASAGTAIAAATKNTLLVMLQQVFEFFSLNLRLVLQPRAEIHTGQSCNHPCHCGHCRH